jgi:hypothetical protein
MTEHSEPTPKQGDAIDCTDERSLTGGTQGRPKVGTRERGAKAGTLAQISERQPHLERRHQHLPRSIQPAEDRAIRTYRTQYPLLTRGPIDRLGNERIRGHLLFWQVRRTA